MAGGAVQEVVGVADHGRDQLAVDRGAGPVGPELGRAVDDGHAAGRAAASSRAVLGTTPTWSAASASWGNAERSPTTPRWISMVSTARPTGAGEVAQVDGHRDARSPSRQSGHGPWRCGGPRCRSPRAPRPRWRRPTGSRACRSASARSCPPRGAAGAPCSRRWPRGSGPGCPRGWGARSARGWMMAATRWPHRSSGAPTTMASKTSGWERTADSTSSGKIFSPPELMRDRAPAEQGDRAVGLDGGEVAGHDVAHAVDGDEDLGRLDRVVVVADGDVAERAILPITPEPGSTGFRSSSKTTVSPRTVTVGPALHGGVALAHGDHAVVARLGRPDGVDDDEVGEVRKNSSFTGAEKRAADEVTASSEDRS